MRDSQDKVRAGIDDEGKSASPLIDIAAVATRLGVGERYVRRLVAERRIPFVKLGHLVRFDPGEVEAWVASARVPVGGRRPLS